MNIHLARGRSGAGVVSSDSLAAGVSTAALHMGRATVHARMHACALRARTVDGCTTRYNIELLCARQRRAICSRHIAARLTDLAQVLGLADDLVGALARQ